MYPPAGGGSPHRDDYNVSQEVHDHRHYYYQDSAVLQSPSSSAPDAHHYHSNRMENQMPQFNSHSEGQMLSYTAPRQYSSLSSVRIPTLETSHLHLNDTYSSHSDLHVSHSPPNTYAAAGRRPGFLSALDTSESSLHNANYGLLASASATDASTDSDKWETPVSDSARSLTQSARKRRTKEKIALAPDQPPTTQGKPRSRVYVACLQCRTRKIRCDGAKPTCYNCSKRAVGGSDCNYDAVPKRRGPDKNPGARQRLARDLQSDIEMDDEPRRRRRRTDTSAYQSPAESPSSTPNSAYFSSSHVATSSSLPFSEPSSPYGGHHDSIGHLSHVYSPPVLHGCLCHGADPCPVALLSPNEVYIRRTEPTEYPLPSPRAGLRSRGYIRPMYNDNEGEDGEVQNISQQPSSEYTRKTCPTDSPPYAQNEKMSPIHAFH